MNQVPQEILTESYRKLLQFWGKARPASLSGHCFHPCVYHSLDVAAVGKVMLEEHHNLLSFFATSLKLPAEGAQSLLLFLLALHDVGKISSSFQSQVPERWPTAAVGPLESATPGRHDFIGRYRLMEKNAGDGLNALAGLKPRARAALVVPVVGHHGRPPDATDRLMLDPACTPYVRLFCQVMNGLFAPVALPALRSRDLEALSWRLAGFTVLCDWVGSRQAWFPYEPPNWGPSTYFETFALPRAAKALAAAGILGARVSTASTFCTLTGSKHVPSPIQAWADNVMLPAGPILVLIEDMTGSGKTEAALIIAKRLMDRGSARGAYVALPTMATANGMYARLADTYRRFFESGESPSLVLAHSARWLHQGFSDTVRPFRSDILVADANRIDTIAEAQHLGTESEQSADRLGDDAGAACAAWVADDRRKAFLADIGVGTIDQAFLSVLPTRYQSLRLFGMVDRVLVVDEAHAFDAYMDEELRALLRFQAACGGSAVVLSATLPVGKRHALAAAFTKGLGIQSPPIENCGYPLTTVIGRTEAAEQRHGTRPDLPRELSVVRLADAEEACSYVATARQRGAAVAWVRNTVDDVFDAADMLEAMGHPVTVFHARMAMGDRLVIEDDVVARFGRRGTADNRPGLLVATQVIEQSLDLDFDAMVSDLAPIDLLLQRAGRLWRHTDRSRPVPGPELAVVSPEPVGDAETRWYEAAFPRAAWVYRDHALLWLSARTLFGRSTWRIPEDVRDLIETVDRDLGDRTFPQALERKANEAEGSAGAARSHARANVLSFEKGYSADNGPWDSDVRTPTRLGDDTVTVRLARVDGERLRPWFDADEVHRAWSLSEVSVRANRMTSGIVPPHLKVAADRVRASWTRFDQHKLLVLLALDTAGAWRGEAVDSRGLNHGLMYTRDRGLRW